MPRKCTLELVTICHRTHCEGCPSLKKALVEAYIRAMNRHSSKEGKYGCSK